jgi:crotonobetaine/carnitine-CoA ligase
MSARQDAAYLECGLRRAPLRDLPPSERNLPALFDRQAEAYGDKNLITFGELRRTYVEMRDAVARAAGSLAAAGVEPGDRVALFCRNRVELLDLLLGCVWLGAVGVPVNTAVRGEQLSHVLTNSGARFLGVDGDLVEFLGFIEPPPALEYVWALDELPGPAPAGYQFAAPPSGGEPLPRREIDPGETATIIYTSGTTGPSKGVCCPQAYLYWWGVLCSEAIDIDDRDVLWTCLPLYHINAFSAFIQALVSGASYVIDAKFSASRFWQRAAEVDATVTYILGAMVNMLAVQEPRPSDRGHRIDRILAPAGPAQLWGEFTERFGVELIEGYASTETNCVLGNPRGQHRPGWMGRVVDGFQIEVVDEHDEPVAPGEAGEMVLRSDYPFAFATGYFGMPEKTVEAWRNLWFHSGDRVLRDADGWFRFVDRQKDAIRRRGENVSSYEVEAAIVSHPAVKEVAAFAVPSEMAEDEVMVAVVLDDPGTALDPAELIEHCRPRLARFAIPRYIDFVEELELTQNGKVRKAPLRERGVTGVTWDREKAAEVT